MITFWIVCFMPFLFLKNLRFVVIFVSFRLITLYYYDGLDICLKLVSYFVMIIVSFTVITLRMSVIYNSGRILLNLDVYNLFGS